MPFLWDQGPKFVTLWESRIRSLGTEMGSAVEKHILRYDPGNRLLAKILRDRSLFNGGGRATKLKKKFGSEIVVLPLLAVSKIVALPKFEFKK